jgi:kinesin family protein 1
MSERSSPELAKPAEGEEEDPDQPSGNVRVAVRVRPFSQREIDAKSRCIITMDEKGKKTTIIDPVYYEQDIKEPKAWERTFDFDHSFWSFDR